MVEKIYYKIFIKFVILKNFNNLFLFKNLNM